ncbi:cyclase family protein [Methylacidiphilum caldifontis]|uniref:cyclase family protein n=1 Tax=Methylacidiphilum caldifontis TaxID=2795386 RepID=UPI001A8C2801|nr:cyclase family protein [Methylacidiphilum caldifontis]QSR87946.1 cyclase family protein [Methylacidiphilum caldifontis]
MRVSFPASLHFRTLIDLSYPLDFHFPIFPGQEPVGQVSLRVTKEDGYASNRWDMPEHWGTHLDAPLHYSKGGKTVADIALSELFCPLAVINITNRAATDPDTEVSLEDILSWEREHGLIPEKCVVIMYSGWGKWVYNPQFYNKKEDGLLHFPGFSVEAVQFLINAREISGIGVDTLSIDRGKSQDYPVHKTLFAAGKWALECLHNVQDLPPAGAWILVGPIPLKGATGFPARVFGLIP